MPILVHGANILFLVAYVVRDILKLRLMALGAGLFLLGFHLSLQPPAWEFVAWDLLFAVIQIIQIRRLILERRPVALTQDERLVSSLAFRALMPREIKRLCAAAEIGDLAPGTSVVKTGETPQHLILILQGKIDVRVKQANVATLGEGQFVGEMSFLTEGKATADAIVAEPSRLARFRRAELAKLMEKTPDLRTQIQCVLGRDLVAKLKPREPEVAAG